MLEKKKAIIIIIMIMIMIRIRITITITITITIIIVILTKQKTLFFQICYHFQQLSKGGRSVKAKRRGTPSGETPRMVAEHITAIAPPPPPNEDPHPQFIPTSLINERTCPICLDIVRSPVHLSCDHTVCVHCCSKHMQVSYSLQCPCCYRHTLSSITISITSAFFLSLLNDSIVCIRKCGNMVKLQDYHHHLHNCCKTHHVNINSPSKVTLKDVLCQPITSPATPVEHKAAQHLVKRLLHQGEGAPGVVQIPTGGQVYNIISLAWL